MALSLDYAQKQLAAIQPTAYLGQLTQRFEADGPKLIDAIFDIALDKRVSVQYRLQAIRELGAMSGATVFMQNLAAAVAKKAAPEPPPAEGDGDGLTQETREHLEALAASAEDPAAAPVSAEVEGDPDVAAAEGPSEGAGGAGRVHGGRVEGPRRKAGQVRQDSRSGKRLPGSGKGKGRARGASGPVRNGQGAAD